MKWLRHIRNNINSLSIQIILLTLIVLAMTEFISVSFIIKNTIEELNIDNKEYVIKLFMSKITIINVSMILLFSLIVLLVTKVFKKINNYAFYSCTTGLPNKNYMLNNLMGEISKNPQYAAVISLDMDDFKAVNDTLGHLSGDELLKQAGERFEQVIDIKDCVCHIGGDEFLFFIRAAKKHSDVEKVAKKIIDVFSNPFIVNGNIVDYVTASAGIALIPQDGKDFQTLYNCSDDAMYSAKKLCKSNYKFYDKSMSMHLYEESVKKKEIKDGIQNKEFKAFYQPKFSKNGILIGAEALARWVKKDGSIIPPAEFISFTEKIGLIVSITDAIIDEVCTSILGWIVKGYENFSISINITSEHIVNEKLCRQILNRVNAFNIPPQYLEFEITESMVIDDFDMAVSNIKMIKDFGIKISMDDFGTGYSSLNYLKKLPIDIIKIDKSFIDAINKDDKDKILLKNIINISHEFQLEVIAEGVENIHQYEILKKMQCDMFQGYYFGKPVEEKMFETLFLEMSL